MTEPELKEYAVTLAVTASPHQAAKLRTILRETVELHGFTVTAGVVCVETWMVRAMAVEQYPMQLRGGESEHHMDDNKQ